MRLLLTFVLVCGLGFCGEKPHDTTTDAVIKVGLKTINDDYSKNEISADAKYKGKLVEIQGKVYKVGRLPFINTPFVLLDGGPNTIQFEFSDSDIEQLSKLNHDDEVALVGRCAGLSFGIVSFQESYISKDSDSIKEHHQYRKNLFDVMMSEDASSEGMRKRYDARKEYFSKLLTKTDHLTPRLVLAHEAILRTNHAFPHFSSIGKAVETSIGVRESLPNNYYFAIITEHHNPTVNYMEIAEYLSKTTREIANTETPNVNEFPVVVRARAYYSNATNPSLPRFIEYGKGHTLPNGDFIWNDAWKDWTDGE